MNTRILSVSLLVVAIIITAFVFFRPKNSTPPEREMAISDEAVATDLENTSDIAPSSEKALTPYSREAVSQSATEGKALLFFHAPWCPFCRAAEADILSKYDQIPPDVTIFKVDYDSEKELKSQYGVTTQHTFVQVDADGKEITKWVGGETLEELLGRLK